MLIYKVTNKCNNKSYIGQTIKSLNKRKNEHLQRAKCGVDFYFYRALRKHGYNKFNWEILCECKSKNELNEMEFHYIKQYDTYKPNGYNLTMGGDGMFGYVHTNETKKKISISLKGKNNGMYGKHHTNKVKRIISKSNKGRKLTKEQLKNGQM